MNIQNLLEINNLSTRSMPDEKTKEASLLKACSLLKKVKNLKIVVTTAGLFVSEINARPCELPVFVELPEKFLSDLSNQMKLDSSIILSVQTALLFLQSNAEFFQRTNSEQANVVAMYEYFQDISGKHKLYKYNIGNY